MKMLKFLKFILYNFIFSTLFFEKSCFFLFSFFCHFCFLFIYFTWSWKHLEIVESQVNVYICSYMCMNMHIFKLPWFPFLPLFLSSLHSLASSLSLPPSLNVCMCECPHILLNETFSQYFSHLGGNGNYLIYQLEGREC